MERPWLKSHPPGMPAEVDSGELASLQHVLLHSVWRHADPPACSHMGATLTCAELERSSHDLTACLQQVRDRRIALRPAVVTTELGEICMRGPQVMQGCWNRPDEAAAGAPDAKSGEVVKVLVVKKDPQLRPEALRHHCRQHFAPCQVPRPIELRTEPLPKTKLGKLLRRELRTTPATDIARRATHAAAH